MVEVTPHFAQLVASYIGARDPDVVYRFLSQWQPWEGGSASFNPLNTTQGASGATDYNSVGVKNYPSEEAGALATAQTLMNGYYPHILSGLQSGSIDYNSVIPDLRTWGSSNFAANLEQGAPQSVQAPANPNYYAQSYQQDGLGHYWDSTDQQWHNNNDGSVYGASPTVAIHGFSRGAPVIMSIPGGDVGGGGSPDYPRSGGGSSTMNDPTMNAYGVSSNPWGFSDGALNVLFSKYPGLTLEQAVAAEQRAVANVGQQTPDNAANNATTQRGQDIGSADSRRGQDITAANNAANNATTQRGQDITAATAARGQDITAQGQQLDYNARMAQIAQAKYDSDLRYQASMASATNDAQRNQIEAQHYAEQAVIAKMEDQTKLLLGQQGNQVQQYGEELNHQAQMADVALKQNAQIADMASKPRNYPELFFMQRGYAPDWNTIAAGGTPAQGYALAPVNPFTAFTPTTSPVDFSRPLVNPYTSQVGTASQAGISTSTQANPYISSTPRAQAPAPASPVSTVAGGGYGPVGAPGGGGGGSGGTVPTAIPYAPPQLHNTTPATNYVNPYQSGTGTLQSPHIGTSAPTQAEATAPGAYSGVPNDQVAGMNSGDWRFVTTGTAGPSSVGDFSGFKVFDSSRNQFANPTQSIGAGTPIWLQKMAYGGVTRAKNLMVGDAAAPDPTQGGALPEVIQNPTGAPLAVIPNPQNVSPAQQNDPAAVFNQVLMGLGKRQPLRRFALGTVSYGNDNPMFSSQPTGQAAYNAAGMGSAWIPTSNNSYANSQPTPMPTLLHNLAGYGYPVTPGLYSATTGSNMPTQNFASAFSRTAGGGNVMPSLQTLQHMTPSEMDYYRGYVEGPMGVSWNDLTDYLTQSTANLGKAADARGAY